MFMEAFLSDRDSHRDQGPRRALLVAVAAGQAPAEYLRAVFELRDTDLRRALIEATHLDHTADS